VHGSQASAPRTFGKVAVSFPVADQALQWTPRPNGGEAVKVTILLVSLDKDRNIQSFLGSTMNLVVKDPSAAAAGVIQDKIDVVVNAKTCLIRLVVRDSTGKIGTADLDHAALTALGDDISSHCEKK
jgi:hypothetical protein